MFCVFVKNDLDFFVVCLLSLSVTFGFENIFTLMLGYNVSILHSYVYLELPVAVILVASRSGCAAFLTELKIFNATSLQ